MLIQVRSSSLCLFDVIVYRVQGIVGGVNVITESESNVNPCGPSPLPFPIRIKLLSITETYTYVPMFDFYPGDDSLPVVRLHRCTSN